MTARIINGREIAADIRLRVKREVSAIKDRGLPPPALAVILTGDDPASRAYVSAKEKACAATGIRSQVHHLAQDTPEQKLLSLVGELNATPDIHGVLVQLPLPGHIAPTAITGHITPEKDVDGFHPFNLGRLCQRHPVLRPCTPRGIIEILETTDDSGAKEPLLGKNALVVGASGIVGRPMALELLMAGATVTVAHRFTRNLEEQVGRAEIVIVATGKPGLIRGHWIKPGAVVIDVGITRLEDGSLCGDVEFEAARQRAALITPVPGGVGPVTVACLLQNTLEAYRMQIEKGASSQALS